MTDDTRTRAIEAILADLRRGGGHGVVTAEQAVDALLAAGWRPPAETPTDVKRAALLHACLAAADVEIGPETTLVAIVKYVVDALAAAGLLAGTRKAPGAIYPHLTGEETPDAG